jgi:hypothetical protein
MLCMKIKLLIYSFFLSVASFAANDILISPVCMNEIIGANDLEQSSRFPLSGLGDIDLFATNSSGAAGVPLTITWIYTNIEEGYDHTNRMEVYVDGEKVGTSSSLLESEKGSYTVYVQPGDHEIRLENHTLYEGTWELHSLENNYSIDAFYTGNFNFKKKKRKIDLVFDIETGETTAKIK